MAVANVARPSYRCRVCERHWPYQGDYAECPACREPTFRTALKPMDEDEAEHLTVHYQFGWWLWENERL